MEERRFNGIGENSRIAPISRSERIINHFPRVTALAQRVLPERVQTMVARRVRSYENHPQEGPFYRGINDIYAAFELRTPSDYRIAREYYEHEFGEQLIGAVNPGDIFLDVGSAQGLFSIIAAKAGARSVYAVDPDPESVDAISRNLTLNPDIVERVHVLPLALGSVDNQIMDLYVDPKVRQAPSLRCSNKSLSQKTRVDVRTVDELISDGIMETPDIVKIDVEGAEGQVLSGMRATLTSINRPKHLFIELHRSLLPHFGTSMKGVMQQIVDMDYLILGEPIIRGQEYQYHFMSGE